MRRLYALTRRITPHEQCELCAAPIVDGHEHVFAPASREIACACDPCALVLTAGTAYRRIPRRHERVVLASMDEWLGRLGVPVGVAAVTVRTNGEAQVSYPGPVGLAVTPIDPATWAALCEELPAARELAPEVEALLWSRLGHDELWRVGIDVVFSLVGELRRAWVGLTGGPDAPAAVRRVLDRLREAA